jgi:hypothetical protein
MEKIPKNKVKESDENQHEINLEKFNLIPLKEYE